MQTFQKNNNIYHIFVEHAKNAKYSDKPREVIEEDVIKAIKLKLNNEEQAWKRQQRGHGKEKRQGWC